MPLYMLSEDEFDELYQQLSTAEFIITSITKVFDIFGTSTISINYDVEISSAVFKLKSIGTLFRLLTLKCQEKSLVPAFPELLTYDAASESPELVKLYFGLSMKYIIRSQKCTDLIKVLLCDDQSVEAEKFQLSSDFLGYMRKSAEITGNIVKFLFTKPQQEDVPEAIQRVESELTIQEEDYKILQLFTKSQEALNKQLKGEFNAPTPLQRYFEAEQARRQNLSNQIDKQLFIAIYIDTLKILKMRCRHAEDTERKAMKEKSQDTRDQMLQEYAEALEKIDEDWLVIMELKLELENQEECIINYNCAQNETTARNNATSQQMQEARQQKAVPNDSEEQREANENVEVQDMKEIEI